MAKARKTAPAFDLDRLVAQAREHIESEAFVKVSALGPAPARSHVTETLRSLGFEVTKSTVRRPLREQLLEAVSQGAFVPVKSFASFVRGGTAKEAKGVAMELAQEGRLARVIRGSAEILVPVSAPTYTRDELLVRSRALDTLVKTLTKASKLKGVSVLRSDVVESIEEALPEFTRSARSSSATSEVAHDGKEGTILKVFAALDAMRDESLGLSFIPRVVAHLGRDMGVDAARKSLLDAASRGLVELRPEGGLRRLNGEELELCLPGPQGTRLSWARRIEGGTS
jgi:hypothetical protein